MWDEQKRQRFQRLRQQETDGTLTVNGRGELDSLVAELVAWENAALAPAMERLEQEHDRFQQQNRQQEVVVRRKQALVRRLREFLAEVRAEQQAIAAELAAVATGTESSETDE